MAGHSEHLTPAGHTLDHGWPNHRGCDGDRDRRTRELPGYAGRPDTQVPIP